MRKPSIPALEHISFTILRKPNTNLVASMAKGKRHCFLDVVGTTLCISSKYAQSTSGGYGVCIVLHYFAIDRSTRESWADDEVEPPPKRISLSLRT